MQTAANAQARGWRSVYFNAQAIPYWLIHVGAIAGVAALGWSWRGLAWAIGLYAVRLFFVTGAYHRYFAHRSFKTSRWFQFVLALGATATAQKGVLWWAAHHRRHHRGSDTVEDLHSPYHGGFWWSHMGWILARDFEGTDHAAIKDFARYPELRWLDRYWVVPVLATAVASYLVGGWFGLTWAFAVSQVLCWHGTFTINSLSHLWGKRRYETRDHSRNNPVLALITLGDKLRGDALLTEVAVVLPEQPAAGEADPRPERQPASDAAQRREEAGRAGGKAELGDHAVGHGARVPGL